ncbi:hypothetical protein AAVH_25749 [Aphelenchoides avenae]|nr:hypothetical protein AAVH_30366 [Aphelenchus avenae]KAH7707018.1 hypothetical protein AAVH_25749 [Aphelenchus avenae]
MNSMERWDPRVALARYRHEKRAPRWRQAVMQDNLDFDVMPISVESRQPSVKLFFFDRKNRTSFHALN